MGLEERVPLYDKIFQDFGKMDFYKRSDPSRQISLYYDNNKLYKIDYTTQKVESVAMNLHRDAIYRIVVDADYVPILLSADITIKKMNRNIRL